MSQFANRPVAKLTFSEPRVGKLTFSNVRLPLPEASLGSGFFDVEPTDVSTLFSVTPLNSGVLHIAVTLAGATPTPNQVVAGIEGGILLKQSFDIVTGGVDFTGEITGMSEQTAYTLHAVIVSNSQQSIVYRQNVTTTSETLPPVLQVYVFDGTTVTNVPTQLYTFDGTTVTNVPGA